MDSNRRGKFHCLVVLTVFMLFFVALLKLTTTNVLGYTGLQTQVANFGAELSSFALQSDRQNSIREQSTDAERHDQIASAYEIVFPKPMGDNAGLHLSPRMAEKVPIETLDNLERMALEQSWWWESWPWLMIIVSSISLIGYLLIPSRRLVNIGDAFPDD